jgi:hypothetical protein
MPSFTCPACGYPVTKDPDAATLGYCSRCRKYTGLCGADLVGRALLATGIVSSGKWSWPCTLPGTERWRVVSRDCTVTDTMLCTSHGDYLRRGGAEWMETRGLQLICLDVRDKD